MLKKVMEADQRSAPIVDRLLPFELLYGRQPWGLLDVAKEAWEQQLSPHRTCGGHEGPDGHLVAPGAGTHAGDPGGPSTGIQQGGPTTRLPARR